MLTRYLCRRLRTVAIIRVARCRWFVAVWLFSLALVDTGAQAQGLTLKLDELLAADPSELAKLLEYARPSPLSAAVKAQILDGLPQNGEITDLDQGSQKKILALNPVLRAAKRESVYVIKVISVPQAAVGFHARTVVLVSYPALKLLAPDELQSVVAHEIGHEYVWAEYERASRLEDHGALQELELVCDVIAILTLRAIGQDGSALLTGLEKMIRFNREQFGTALHEGNYPTLARRRAVSQAVEAGRSAR